MSSLRQYRTFTNDGDLDYMLDNGYTVGQEICLRAFTDHGVESIWYETVSRLTNINFNLFYLNSSHISFFEHVYQANTHR